MNPIVLVLPYPISANRYWMPINVKARADSKTGKTRQIFIPTKEANNYKEQVAWIARGAGIKKPLDCRVHIHIELYPQTDGRCIDLDNARKCLYDSLKKVVILDDNHKIVRKDSGEIMDADARGARMIVTITPLPMKIIQPSLLENV